MDQWLADFKETVDSAAPRLLQITEAQSEQPRAEDHWSSKQIIGHLIDSAANNHARFVLGQIKDDFELWRAYNLHLLHVMSWAAPAKLHHRCTQHSLQTIAFETVSESEPATLEYLMQDYVVHLKHHLGQILGASA